MKAAAYVDCPWKGSLSWSSAGVGRTMRVPAAANGTKSALLVVVPSNGPALPRLECSGLAGCVVGISLPMNWLRYSEEGRPWNQPADVCGRASCGLQRSGTLISLGTYVILYIVPSSNPPLGSTSPPCAGRTMSRLANGCLWNVSLYSDRPSKGPALVGMLVWRTTMAAGAGVSRGWKSLRWVVVPSKGALLGSNALAGRTRS
mmetsp:Transcript_11499/g.28114  ORF Transcript_11499/g.28114 Transcript_11499/m.28114 type:complete len:203 (+) Transcript_11499:30-638(+)